MQVSDTWTNIIWKAVLVDKQRPRTSILKSKKRIRTLCVTWLLLRRPSRRLFLIIAHDQPWGDTPGFLTPAAVDLYSKYTYVHDIFIIMHLTHFPTVLISFWMIFLLLKHWWSAITILGTEITAMNFPHPKVRYVSKWLTNNPQHVFDIFVTS